MGKRKPMKERGKIRFSEYFKSLKIGEKVAVKKEQSIRSSFPSNIQGKTGIVVNKRGKSYEIKIGTGKSEKLFIIHSIHLKKLKQIEAK